MQPSLQSVPMRQKTLFPNDRAPRPRSRMLVVEDARCVQRMAGTLLGRMNIEVEMAENGQIACEMAEKSRSDGAPYDLILMDMQMPVMNGCTATQWLRQHGWKGPIVAASVYTTEEDRDRFVKAGCDDCIAKPLAEASLRSMLARHLLIST
jgi:CheY-like chemotaxis protein